MGGYFRYYEKMKYVSMILFLLWIVGEIELWGLILAWIISYGASTLVAIGIVSKIGKD